jgi:hypothetical protein
LDSLSSARNGDGEMKDPAPVHHPRSHPIALLVKQSNKAWEFYCPRFSRETEPIDEHIGRAGL